MTETPSMDDIVQIINTMEWSEECCIYGALDDQEHANNNLKLIHQFFYNPDTGLLNQKSQKYKTCTRTFSNIIQRLNNPRFNALYSFSQINQARSFINEMTYALEFFTRFYTCYKQTHEHYTHNRHKQELSEILLSMTGCLDIVNQLINTLLPSFLINQKTKIDLFMIDEVIAKANQYVIERPLPSVRNIRAYNMLIYSGNRSHEHEGMLFDVPNMLYRLLRLLVEIIDWIKKPEPM